MTSHKFYATFKAELYFFRPFKKGETMTTLQKCPVIVIDPDEDRAEEVRKMLERSMEKVAVINTKCLSSCQFKEISELVCDGNYLKLFYGCSENFFKETIESLSLKSGELKYIGWKLDISKIVICFWNHNWCR
ncbi:MAG: hypothetical protein A2W59_02240 [Candidatus Terrybacteria bacterium RIFCSPHIGHO2_02_41_19]|uniref:Uncharacterized protein n=2 Tax=Candidatus Terryibacteriota TaxID=1817920 RepID=A0A1G2PLB3_9BACT|nr:MAG: hypothetical protein A2W59_02240 [Candidatus Terrybacteria bacterium RIFCSPHIGHO2_02_41_19]